MSHPHQLPEPRVGPGRTARAGLGLLDRAAMQELTSMTHRGESALGDTIRDTWLRTPDIPFAPESSLVQLCGQREEARRLRKAGRQSEE